MVAGAIKIHIMLTKEMLEYIQERKKQKATDDEIREELKSAGWEEEDIKSAFKTNHVAPPIYGTASSPFVASGVLPGSGQLLSESWTIYKSKIKIITCIFIAPILISIATVAITEIEKYLSKQSEANPLLPLLLLVAALLNFAGIFIALWANLAIIYVIHKTEAATFQEAFQNTKSLILSSWLINFIIALVTITGYFFFFIPGILFGFWFSLSIFVLVAENLKGFDALIRSKEYAKGHVLSMLWRVLMLSLFILLILIVGILIPIIVLSIIGLGIIASIYLVAVAIVLALVSVPFATIYGYLIFKYLKAIKGPQEYVPELWKKQKTIFKIIACIAPVFMALITFLLVATVLYSLNNTNSINQGILPGNNDESGRILQDYNNGLKRQD